MSIRWVKRALTAGLFLTAGVFYLSEFLTVQPGRDHKAQAAIVAPATFPVIRAVKPLAHGSVIGPDEVELHLSPVAPPKGAITSLENATDRIAIRDIANAEPLSDVNTAAAVEGTSLSQVIPQGLRAVALRVSEVSSVANLIKPGDRVDVLVVSNAARTPPAAGMLFPPAQAVTVLQNVPVLAVGGVTVVPGSKDSNAPVRTVALAVTPRQAAMMALVPTVGSEYLSLRPANDEVEIATAPVSTRDLQPNQAVDERPARVASPPAPPRPRTRTIEVIAGKSDNVSRVSLAGDR